MNPPSKRSWRVPRVLATALCIAVLPAHGQTVATAVEVGFAYGCVRTSAGGAKCWGINSNFGMLGDGTLTNRQFPVDVSGLTTGVAAISIGSFHACAVTAGGALKCWGMNENGVLGDGTTAYRKVPTDVVGLGSGVAAVAAGEGHTCALTTAGAVMCWGNNDGGCLGDGTTTSRWIPAPVTGLASGVVAIAAGAGHTCALTSGGSVKCWGRNDRGAIGDGTLVDRLVPVDIVVSDGPVVALAAGELYSCAVTAAGGARCWGHNYAGALGDGTLVDRPTAVDVAGLSSGVAAITAGRQHTCALTTAGGVKCWGTNNDGELGDGTRDRRVSPADVVSLASGVASVTAGPHHTCALTTPGGVKCWGDNYWGSLGDGTWTDRPVPVDVLGLNDADGDGLPNDAELAEGRDPGVRDNDVFADTRLFPMQQYRDFLLREGEPAGVDGWSAILGSASATRERVVDAFFSSAEFAQDIAPVARLYFACFQRAPDYDGLVFNARVLRGGKMTRAGMATFFAASPEFKATYGILHDAPLVTRLYLNAFGRAPDPETLSTLLTLLDGGARLGEVVLAISDSAEFQAAISNEVFATMIYAGLLKRSPDPTGFPLWVAYLDSAPYLHEYAIDAVLRSAEYRARFLP